MLHVTVTVVEYLGTTGVSAVMWDRDDMGSSHWLGSTPETFYDIGEFTGDPLLAVLLAVRKWANVHIPPESLALAGREKTRNDETAGGGVAGLENSAAAKPSPSKG